MHYSLKSLFTIALALVAFAVSAQVQISVGPRVGVNLAKWSIDSEDDEIGDLSNQLGFLAGAVAEIRFNESFALQPEINFLQKGVKTEFSVSDSIFGDYSDETQIVLNYLEVPIMLKVGKSFGGARVDVLAGPSFGYAMSGKFKSKGVFDGEPYDEEEDIDFDDDEFNRIDFGVQVGAAVTFGLGNANLFIDGRYLLNFSNLNDSSDDETKAYNRGIVLSAGVLFPL